MASSRELAEKAFSLLQNALHDSESRAAELDAELKKKRTPRNQLEKQTQVLEHRLETVDTERENWQREAERLEEILANERAKLQQLKRKLELAESGPDKVGKKEVNYWRARAEQFDEEAKEYKKRIDELRKALNARPEPEDDRRTHELEALIEERESQLEDLRSQVKDRDARIEALTREATELRSRTGELEPQVSDLETRVDDLKAQNSQLNSDLADKATDAADQASQLRDMRAELAEKKRLLAERDQRIVELAGSQHIGEEEKQAIRDQIAGLEEELKEEKECKENLGEIANERREQITELSEKLEEAQERYEEAKWRLEQAGRFERLVIKRRKLIDSLISDHRAKQKSNNALKAGLDGLRRFKAKSEQQQQKLLVRIEELTRELKQAEERLANRKGSQDADEKRRKAEKNVSALEERLNTQVAVIENLESELSAAKAARQTTENHSKEISELKTMLKARNETIERLEADLDEQQTRLGKLRGSESETMRLKAAHEQDHSLIDELQAKVGSLTEELAEQHRLAEGGVKDAAAASAAEIRKRDAQISDLKRAIKDQEKEIVKLQEAVSGWQKKYEFISTEAPSAYQSVAAEK